MLVLPCVKTHSRTTNEPTLLTFPCIKVDSASFQAYRYRKLPNPNSIRLLRLEGTRLLLPDNTIQKAYSLDVYDLNKCPPYYTLSYTWDSPIDDPNLFEAYSEQSRCIIKEQNMYYQISIKRNLHEFLSRIESLEDWPIWIDFLCICQTDLAERGSQVQLMRQIYSQSRLAFIWLGEVLGRDIAGCARTVSSAAAVIRARVQTPGSKPDMLHNYTWTKNDLQGVTSLSLGESAWASYFQFIEERRWFQRCWVYQEACFAPQIDVRCGEYEFDLLDLTIVAAALGDSGLGAELLGIHSSVNPASPVTFFYGLRHMCQNMEWKNWLQENKHMFGLPNTSCVVHWFFYRCLDWLRMADCSDPRDKVFSALGFLDSSSPTHLILTPDYSLSVQEVYTQTAVILLRQLPDLALLGMVEDASLRKTSNLPSWVPDFSVQDAFSLLGATTRYLEGTYITTRRDRTRPLGPDLVRVVGSRLMLRGARVDTVSAIQHLPSVMEGDTVASGCQTKTDTDNVSPLALITSWLLLLGGVNAYEEPLLSVLWRTLVANVGALTHDSATDEMFSTQIGNVCSVVKFGEDIPRQLHYMRDIGEARRNETKNGAPRPDDYLKCSTFRRKLTKIESHLYPLYRSRRLFTTINGRLGVGAKSVKETDEVWLLDGGTPLYLLRATDEPGTYIFVGEAYVHGLVDGEAMENSKDCLETVTLI